jgi:N-methylhydantoinase A
VAPGEVRAAFAADMRYVGQAYELEVPIAVPVAPDHLAGIAEAFHRVHERVYGYARRGQPVEFVNFRATHTYPLPAPAPRAAERVEALSTPRVPADAQTGERPAYFPSAGFLATAIFDRARLSVGAHLSGPAIIEQPDTTTVVPPGYTAVVETSGNLRIRRAP